MTDHPRTVQDIVANYEMRKAGLQKALTDDVDEFFNQCHPDRDNLCLYGETNGTWTVDLPAEEVPAELPEPCLGINFARDGMAKKDWLALVAVHSDAWLLSVAFYYGAKLDAGQRAQLFGQINASPTLFEIVTGKAKPPGSNKRARSTEKRRPGRPLKESDINPGLKGKRAELYWPDDGGWYKVQIISCNPKTKSAKIQYDTGDYEDLDLTEVLGDDQMYLLE